MSEKYSGSEWLVAQGKDMSPLGVKVADILGQAFLGIYHIEKIALKTDWFNKYWIEVTGLHSLSTFDNELLTVLVVLCHDECIRMNVEPAGSRNLRLIFHQRQRDGRISERMPTMEDHIESIRKNYSLGGE